MKRTIFGVALLILLCAAQTALGLEFSPYRVDADQVYPMSRNEIVTVVSDGETHVVRILRDGEVVREAELKNENNKVTPLILADEQVVLLARRYLQYIEGKEYFRLWYSSGLAPEVALSDGMSVIKAAGQYLYGFPRGDEGRSIVVLDTQGQAVFRRPVAQREGRLGWLGACVADSDSTFLTAVHDENIDGSKQEMLLERVSAQGKVLWQTRLTEDCRYSTNCLIADGRGGAFLLANDADDYKRAWIMRLSAAGELLWSKRLTAEGLIFGDYSGYWDEGAGELVINAHAISKSKGIFDVVRLGISADGDILSVAAKDFSARNDYSSSYVLVAQDGTVFVRSDTREEGAAGGDLVLVPAADLPDAVAPSFTLR